MLLPQQGNNEWLFELQKESIKMKWLQQLRSNEIYVMSRNMRIWINPTNVIRIAIIRLPTVTTRIITVLVLLNTGNAYNIVRQYHLSIFRHLTQ